MRLGPAIFGCIFFLSSPHSFAALGGDTSSIQQDAQALGTRSTVTSFPKYDRYEISRSWLSLHEFVAGSADRETNPSGASSSISRPAKGSVFALAWNGTRHPDLRKLLGDHFGDFQNALAGARKAHRRGGAIIVNSGNFHLEIGGHMNAIYGQIWLTDKVPSGMDLNEIR